MTFSIRGHFRAREFSTREKMPRNVSAFDIHRKWGRTSERMNEFIADLRPDYKRTRPRLFSRKVETNIWKCDVAYMRELGVNKGSARKEARVYTCGWFRARRERTWFISYGHRAHTLVWRTECPCLLKIALTTPAIHLRSIRSHFLPSGQRNQAEFCIYD